MLFWIVLLPWLMLPACLAARRAPRPVAAWLAALAAAISLACLGSIAPQILDGGTLVQRVEWVPSLGLALGLRLDGLGLLFALLILLIGLLVIRYAAYYLSSEPNLGRFYALLLLFMGAMLGVVLAENLLLLFVFWELTSLSSFLLIGYWQRKASARDGARTALTVTGAGGLALLGGILILGHVAGGFDLAQVLASRDAIQSSPLYPAIVALVLLGAFTKSAQVPFHFWLPAAMAAPTPVSAYLHSATMVNAGIFLIARLYPPLAGPDIWFYTLTAAGLVTLVFGAYQAMFRHDLKSLLAYSTISHLGLIVLLFGLGTQLSAVAALFHVINHATFKASLFMAAGIIDHECGTRDMRRINGLWRYMPQTGLLAMVAAASMAGVPLANGFLSKEMFFGESLELDRGGGLEWVLPVVAVMGGVFSVAYSLRFIHDVFFLDRPLRTPRVPHEPPRWMRIPVEVLVAVCLLVGVFPAFSVQALLVAASGSVLGAAPPEFSLALWHGVNLPLVMSAVALGGGVLLYFLVQYGLDLHSHVQGRHSAKRLFDRAVLGLIGLVDATAAKVYRGGFSTGVLVLIVAAIAAGLYPFLAAPGTLGPVATSSRDPYIVVLCALMIAAAMGTVFAHRHRLLSLVTLSAVGLMVALAFAYFSAPDLALTQLCVETVSILLLLLVLRYLPQDAPPETAVDNALRHFFLACIAGGGVGWLAWAMLTRPAVSISGYFNANSVPQGGGANVVNVILVDFRGFDTYGEITVLAIVALGVAAMLGAVKVVPRGREAEARRRGARAPIIPLEILVRVLLPPALMVAAFLFVRGHNHPGGGFIAGLVTAVAIVLVYLGCGVQWTHERLRIDPRAVLTWGLLVAGLTGLGAMAFGVPFLTSAHTHAHLPVLGDVALTSAALFDLGVYLTVVGATLLMLVLLAMAGGANRARGEGR